MGFTEANEENEAWTKAMLAAPRKFSEKSQGVGLRMSYPPSYDRTQN
jgi:hypothetical protein